MNRALRFLFPNALWTSRFRFWWVTSALTLLAFDVMWMAQTTWRPPQFFEFWVCLFLASTLLALPMLFTRNGWINTAILLTLDVLLVANLMYCRVYFTSIPLGSYALVGNLRDFGGSVADAFRWYYILLPLIAVVAISFYSPQRKKNRKKPSGVCYLFTVIILAALVIIGDLPYGGTFKRIDALSDNYAESCCITPVYTVGGYLLYDLINSEKGISADDNKKVTEWLQYHDERMEGMEMPDSLREERHNMVLILCESLESWPIGLSVEGKELTPYINSLIADSTTLYAPNVVTQVRNGRSIDAQLLILAGMLPMRSGVYAYKAVYNDYYTLPKAIKERGGLTVMLSTDRPYVWNQEPIARAFGIDTLIHSDDFLLDEKVGPAGRMSDVTFIKQSVEKLGAEGVWPEGENAFVMLVTHSGHNPFTIPDELKNIELTGDYPPIIKDYMTAVNYTDSSLKPLIDYLKSRDDWEETIVVITGDHEGLADSRATALSNYETKDFVDKSQHTPLIVLNSPVGGLVDFELGQVDIYSTLLDLMNLNGYEWKGMGESILSTNFPGVAFGMLDDVKGDTTNINTDLLEHIEHASKVSDLILQFNLLSPKE